MNWKVSVVTGLFVLGAVCFITGYFPEFAEMFWVLWILGCVSCIAGLILAVTVSTARQRDRPRSRATKLTETEATRR